MKYCATPGSMTPSTASSNFNYIELLTVDKRLLLSDLSEKIFLNQMTTFVI